MASLLVVTGPPGAGKSVVARVLAERLERSALVAGDTFFGFVCSGFVEPWKPESVDQNTTVTRAAGVAAGQYVTGGFDTVFDGVIGPWFADEFLAATGLAHFEYVVLLPSVDRCLERVATRVGHGFNDEGATRHMHDNFATAAVNARHVLVDPPEGVDAVADVITAAVAHGTLTYTG